MSMMIQQTFVANVADAPGIWKWALLHVQAITCPLSMLVSAACRSMQRSGWRSPSSIYTLRQSSCNLLVFNSQRLSSSCQGKHHTSGIAYPRAVAMADSTTHLLRRHEDQRHEMGVKDNDDLCGHPYWRWYPEGGSSSDTRPDLLQYTEYCTISDVNYFVITVRVLLPASNL